MAADEFFYAEQNARLVRNAEEYYRAMFRGRVASWNLRDRHMVETLEALAPILDAARGTRAKIVVWAHNSHLGDARATQMGERGELQRRPAPARATWRGRGAGRLHHLRGHGDGGLGLGRRRPSGSTVRPALRGSYEALFHEVGACPRFFLPLRDDREARGELREPRLERAIGVVYRPETERMSHYFQARIAAAIRRRAAFRPDPRRGTAGERRPMAGG